MSTPCWKAFGLHDYILGLFLFFLPSPSPHIPVKESKSIFKADTHKDKKKTERQTEILADRQKDRNKARDRYEETHLSLLFLLFYCRPNVCPLMLSSSFWYWHLASLQSWFPQSVIGDMAGCSSRTSLKMLWSSVVLMWGLGFLALSWKRSLSVFLHWPHGSLRSSPLWTSLCETTKCDSRGRSETIEH